MAAISPIISGQAPPLKRSYLDYLGGPLRIGFGAAFVAYCALSTVRGVNGDFDAALAGQVWFGNDASFMLGIGAALIVFLVEVATAERFKQVYGIALAVDTFYTFRMTWPWAALILRAGEPWSLWWIAMGAAVVLASALASWVGEVLLFGKRRS